MTNGAIMSTHYRHTDWAKYGITDSTELEKQEQLFHDRFIKICHSEIAKLTKMINDKERTNRAERLMNNIRKRTPSKHHK